MKFHLSAVALTLLPLLACGPESGADKSSVTLLKIAMRRAPDSYNPYLSTSLEGQTVAARLYPTLFRETPEFRDGTPVLEPYLVHAYEWDESRTGLTLHLQPGLAWSDGRPLTAADVAYSFSLQVDPEVAWISADRKARIASWEVVGDNVIRVAFKGPSLFNLLDLNEGVIVPEHYFRQWPVSEWQRDWSVDLVVFGPYRLGTNPTAEQILLQSLVPGALPDLGFTVVRDMETHYQLLRAGQVDYSWTLPVGRLPEILTSLQSACYEEHSFAFIGWNPIDPAAIPTGKPSAKQELERLQRESPHPLFGDVRVRRAMAYAMDREGYLQRFWSGLAQVPATPWQAGPAYHVSTVAATAHDPAKAAALLDEAGWKLRDGQRWKDGRPFRFTAISVAGSEIREQYLLAIQQDLAPLGLAMEIEPQEASRFIQNSVGGQFDAMFGLFQAPSRPDFSALYSSQSQYNFTSWTAVDELLARVGDAADGETLRAGLAALESAFERDQPLTPLYAGVKLAAARPGLQLTPNYLDPLYAVERWGP